MLGICFWREGFEAAFGPDRMGEKGVRFTPDNYQTFGHWPKVNHRVPACDIDSITENRKC